MNIFLCKRCGVRNSVKNINKKPYIYKDNVIKTSSDRCYNCGCIYFYVGVSETLEEVLFPYEDHGYKKELKNVNKIYSSYIPVPGLINEYKECILKEKTSNDLVVGFDGWEDIVIDKELAGGWYMTYNSPPILDVALINCSTYCFGNPTIVMSYFPSPILYGNVKIFMDKTVEYFESMRSIMLKEKRNFYIGIRR